MVTGLPAWSARPVKSPFLSAAVGTLVVNTCPCRSRKLSQLKNQKVLSLIRRPPADAPNWFCVNGKGLFLIPARIWEALRKYSFALKTLLRKYSWTSPWIWLLPDFVLRLITPPENLPHSGPKALVCTLNSWIES